MNSRLRSALLVVLLIPFAAVSAEKKPVGNITDQEGLLKVQSFCIDTRELNPGEISEVKKFVQKEDQPKKLLSKLAWKRAEDCRQADALVPLKFKHSVEIEQTSGGNNISGAPLGVVSQTIYTAELLVTDRSSGKALYHVVSESVRMRQEGAIRSSFSKLARDLNLLSK